MQLRRFQAATVGEAYARVRDALGDEAMIVSTRSTSAAALPGSSIREFVEVVASVPDGQAEAVVSQSQAEEGAAADAAAPAPDAEAATADSGAEEADLAPPFVNAMAGSGRDGPFDFYDRTGSAVAAPPDGSSDSAVAPVADEWPPEQPAAASSEQVAGLAAQIAEVREIVERISLARVDARVDGGPVALQEARSRLIDQGVGPAVLIPVLDKVADAAVPDATQQMVLQTLERQLAAKLPSVVRLDLGRPPLAIFVVGPGGAGKTTVAVRLGVELASQLGARVTLASIDVNRAGAPQQLAAYGAATGLPARPCYSPGELKTLLEDGSSEAVIIDTPANAGTRRDRMTELSAFMQVARERATLLTLPATMKNEDILRVAAAMGAAGIDGLVLTRCDETEAFGALLTAACEHGIGIAYSTHGEGISDPLRGGDNHALALAIVGGRWPEQARAGRAMAAAG